jgi:hypothetical protein
MLKPLQQFICDKCHEIIDSPMNGYVEYLNHLENKNEKSIQIRSGFKIVHHGNDKTCRFFKRTVSQCTLPLSDFLDDNKKHSALFSFLDEGEVLTSENLSLKINNLREFTELAKRTTIPFYEEARIYFDQAKSDGYFDGADGYSSYTPTNLKEIIAKFSD